MLQAVERLMLYVLDSSEVKRYFGIFMVGYFVNTFTVETSCKYLYKVYIYNLTRSFIAQT